MKNNINKLIAIGLLAWSLGAQAATNAHTTTLSLGSPSIDGTTTVVFDWSTAAVSGSINANALIDYSVSLYAGSTQIYSSDVLINGVLQPLDGVAREYPFWDFDLDTMTLRQFNLGVLGILFAGQVPGTHFTIADGDSLPVDGQIHIWKFVDYFLDSYDLAILSNQVTTSGPVTPPAPAAFDYRLIDHPGVANTQIFGINDRGDAVGNGIGGDLYPFVYSSTHDMLTDVAPAAGYASTAVLGISDSGVMVGSVTSLDSSTRSGFIRDKDGTFTVFSHPDAVSQTLPRAVNNDGVVTGVRNDSNVLRVGFIYDPKSGTFTDLNPASFNTFAQGINSKGEVVGSSNFIVANDPCAGLGNPFRRYGWIRATDGAVTFFEVNGSHTSARGINDQGSIVGFFLDLDDGQFKGFKAELDGSQCQSLTITGDDVLEFPGAEATFPGGITNAGDIVGSYNDASNTHGFIATQQ